MDIEDIQAEERYKALDELTDHIVDTIESVVDSRGGEGALLMDMLARKEFIGEILDGLHIAMPFDYGVKTRGV